MDESRSEVEKELEKEIEKKIEQEIEKRVTEGVPVAIAIIIAVGVTFVISLVLFKFVWAWVVPDLFPGAVAQGLIAADLTWFAAFKLAVLVAVLSGFYPTLSEAFKTRP
jgi:hypothetical protein